MIFKELCQAYEYYEMHGQRALQGDVLACCCCRQDAGQTEIIPKSTFATISCICITQLLFLQHVMEDAHNFSQLVDQC